MKSDFDATEKNVLVDALLEFANRHRRGSDNDERMIGRETPRIQERRKRVEIAVRLAKELGHD